MRNTRKLSDRQRRICLLAGLSAGVIADALLRFNSGNDGNLLVHSVFFLVTSALAGGIFGLVFMLKDKDSRNIREKRVASDKTQTTKEENQL